ncbi:exodeoxyribonuclease VII small subunit [Umezakia ovalisporum]|jgi:exodeoxyribonuclease VII small subunit|uniref:Exodeoxyribonuclease 7 small subunit n=2 Tax=Umezakia ovalisporum TaxID=75695 RepID=A0AA43GUW3_9CYAN|nr:exodeoxyribonuclease VII small subunit [Umezakia ovalisporum]MBI1241845.1 exodeoxyribonuclease VII small subunit [Nostoc sp. RI_552]MDH6056387.1 exodeoxyribonuclease VII small subunit [Umezakia ovalisporum FSS-43]MDH6062213.1 exodeoxyribonuclease VII small subunit [Umezakia ovalisporum FSS-62]MDH6068087.1 exodeoxyribonuclease VII small subunit [Umezakia ovalisporum APH033B]MDH6072733.1 exodeoxyribonuclease VII small subunit [Umezakia ovalisporum CobakiLakeA]
MVKPQDGFGADSMVNWSFEEKVVEIEQIIGRIEEGELGLEEVFEQFSSAVESLRECESFLHQRHQQINLLIETLSDD